MAFGIFEVTIGIILLLVWCYHKLSRKDHWEKLGIPGPKPFPFLGNFQRSVLGKTSLVEDLAKLYNDWRKEPFFGIFKGLKPVLVINDPELAKTILIKEFNTFPGRGTHVPENDDSLQSNIFLLDGHRWKVLRSKLTPVFTTGKLKHMVDLILECSELFEQYLLKEVEKNDVIDAREATAKFSTDVIGSCAFGINMNALSNDESEFRKVGKKIFSTSGSARLKRLLPDYFPALAKFIIKLTPPTFIKFFNDMMKDTMDYREKENIFRGDLVDVLREMKDKKDEIDIKLTQNILTAQAITFFAAGFETTSTTISFVLYELALAPNLQNKVRQEIRETLDEHKGKLTYEIITNMKYLDMIIKETLRKNSPAFLAERESVKPWTIPGSNITLPAATKVLIPLYSYHHDPEYFKDPETFDPLRFSEERKSEIISGTYLPFGSGPKNCIGERFAIYQTKLGVVSILKNFKVEPSKFTKKPYTIDKASIILTIEGGVPLKFIRSEC